MSVYIKGMEMPEMPESIEQRETIPFVDVRIFADGTAFISKEKRPYFTPYIAVPVPEHGRLIDADALRDSLKESVSECHKWANEVNDGEMYARVSQSLGTFVECALRVKAAPTIIPASGGKENE